MICGINDASRVGKESAIRSALVRSLPDVGHVDKILALYRKCLKPVLSVDGRQWCKYILWENIRVLGSPYCDNDFIVSEALKYYQDIAPQVLFDVKTKFVAEVRSVCDQYQATVRTRTSDLLQRVVILFPGSSGGGHAAPKDALLQFFRDRKVEPLEIDVDTVEGKYSKNVVGFSRGQVYSEIFQKQGNATKAQELLARIDREQPIEERKYFQDLREQIAAFSPDHIFTVAHHRPEFAAISHQLCVPMTFVHTDQHLNTAVIDTLRSQMTIPGHPPLLTFTAANEFSSFYDESSIEPLLAEKLNTLAISFGIPVRKQFSPISCAEKAVRRRELGISSNAVVCKVAVGCFGIADELMKILQKIHRDHPLFTMPLHVFVICGRNKELKAQVDEWIVQNQSASCTFDCKGFLDADEMGRCDSVSDVWITKPGGSTTAEALQMRMRVLFVNLSSLPWEQSNAHLLAVTGLGKNYEEEVPLFSQINEVLSQPVRVEKLPQTSWDKSLDHWCTARCQIDFEVVEVRERFLQNIDTIDPWVRPYLKSHLDEMVSALVGTGKTQKIHLFQDRSKVHTVEIRYEDELRGMRRIRGISSVRSCSEQHETIFA